MTIVKTPPITKVVDNVIVPVSECIIVSDPSYRTKGESYLIIKDIDLCRVALDHTITQHITIKSLTNAIIIPTSGTIDDEYGEINLQKGSCVELKHMFDGWYVLSSDGLRNDQ